MNATPETMQTIDLLTDQLWLTKRSLMREQLDYIDEQGCENIELGAAINRMGDIIEIIKAVKWLLA